MKIAKQLFAFALLAGITTSKDTTNLNSQKSKSIYKNIELDIIGEVFSNESRPVVAVSYSAPTRGTIPVVVPVGVNLNTPQMVMQLPDVVLPPRPGPYEVVNEVNLLYLFRSLLL